MMIIKGKGCCADMTSHPAGVSVNHMLLHILLFYCVFSPSIGYMEKAFVLILSIIQKACRLRSFFCFDLECKNLGYVRG